MSERTKKWLIIAVLLAVCGGLVFGIGKVLYQEPERKQSDVVQEVQETDVIIDDLQTLTANGEPESVWENEPNPEGLETPIEIDGTISDVEKEPETVKESVQSLQEPVQKTENERPHTPPALTDDSDLSDPQQESYSESVQETIERESSPTHGDTKDGMVYVDGFGWIVDQGGGGKGTIAEDMYENGNKIGIME